MKTMQAVQTLKDHGFTMDRGYDIGPNRIRLYAQRGSVGIVITHTSGIKTPIETKFTKGVKPLGSVTSDDWRDVFEILGI